MTMLERTLCGFKDSDKCFLFVVDVGLCLLFDVCFIAAKVDGCISRYIIQITCGRKSKASVGSDSQGKFREIFVGSKTHPSSRTAGKGGGEKSSKNGARWKVGKMEINESPDFAFYSLNE